MHRRHSSTFCESRSPFASFFGRSMIIVSVSGTLVAPPWSSLRTRSIALRQQYLTSELGSVDTGTPQGSRGSLISMWLIVLHLLAQKNCHYLGMCTIIGARQTPCLQSKRPRSSPAKLIDIVESIAWVHRTHQGNWTQVASYSVYAHGSPFFVHSSLCPGTHLSAELLWYYVPTRPRSSSIMLNLSF